MSTPIKLPERLVAGTYHLESVPQDPNEEVFNIRIGWFRTNDKDRLMATELARRWNSYEAMRLALEACVATDEAAVVELNKYGIEASNMPHIKLARAALAQAAKEQPKDYLCN